MAREVEVVIILETTAAAGGAGTRSLRLAELETVPSPKCLHDGG